MSGNRSKEDDVVQSISAFQQILAIMPDDRLALESLYEAYIGMGDTSNALKYLMRLSDSISADDDQDKIIDIIDKLMFLSDSFPEAGIRAQELQTKLGKTSGRNEAYEQAAKEDPSARSSNIATEIAFAWALFEDGQLNKDDYSRLAHDLTEMTSKQMDVPNTLLHVMYDTEYKYADKIVNYVCNKSKLPYISLFNFEVRKEVVEVLPLNMMIKYGAMPFEAISSEYLIAVLNPFDSKLMNRVKAIVAKPCHFYVTSPGDYDKALEIVKKLLAVEEEE